MKIIIKPSDIVKRCLWDMYVAYIVRDENRAKELLEADEDFVLDEKDALVIGLLNCIETDNLSSKLNTEIMSYLTYKSLSNDGKLYIRKKGFEAMLEDYYNKFPEYWKFPINYKHRYEKLKEYILDIRKAISEIKVTTMVVQNITYEIIPSSQVKKVLNFNNY